MRIAQTFAGLGSVVAVIGISCVASLACASPPEASSGYAVQLPASTAKSAQQGRLMLLFSKDFSDEPRNQVDHTPGTQVAFGMNIRDFKPGSTVAMDAAADGYPVAHIADLAPGEYNVQALLNRYETFHLADGRTLDLPPDQGEGQHWNIKPGNFYSAPQKVHVGAGGKIEGGAMLTLALDQTIAPIKRPADTKYVRHIRIQSALLSKFWGRPMFISDRKSVV